MHISFLFVIFVARKQSLCITIVMGTDNGSVVMAHADINVDGTVDISDVNPTIININQMMSDEVMSGIYQLQVSSHECHT